MQVLFYPMLSQAMHVNGDSGYVFMRKIVTEVLRQRPDWRFIIPFPSNREWTYYKDGFFDDPRIIRVPILLPEGKVHNSVQYDSGYWQVLVDKFPPDVIWTQVVEIAHLLKYARDCYEDRARPVIIAQHHYVVHKSLPYPVDTQQPHVMIVQLIAALMADINVFNSEYCRWMLDDNIRRLLPTIKYAGEVVRYGLVDPSQFDSRQSSEPYQQPTAIYNHRLQHYKRPEVTFEAFGSIHSRHPDFRVIATANNARGADTLRRYPFVTTRAQLGYDDYLTELSRCHINVSHSTHETFCQAAMESLAYGHWLVAPKRVTFPELVPNGYPFLFERDGEAEGMVDHIINNGWWHPDHPKRKQLQNYTRDTYAIQQYAASYITLIEAMNAWFYMDTMKPQTVAKIAKLHEVAQATGRRRIPLHEMRRAMERAHLGHQAMNPIKFKRILNQLGWRDDPDARGMWMLAPTNPPKNAAEHLTMIGEQNKQIRANYLSHLVNKGERVVPASLALHAPPSLAVNVPNIPSTQPA